MVDDQDPFDFDYTVDYMHLAREALMGAAFLGKDSGHQVYVVHTGP